MPTIYTAPPKPTDKKKEETKIEPLMKQKPPPKEIKIIKEEVGLKPTKRTLTSFAFFPQNITFETQESQEHIILLLRRHWIVNLMWIFVSILMALAPLSLSYVPILSFLPSRFQFIVIIMWYLIATAYVFESFLSWYFNVFIVTDERVIDVDFISLTYKEITETKTENIQDVTFRMGGVVRSLFNFGTVFVQTAGEVPRIEFEDVPKPQQVVKILNQLILQEEQEKLEGRIR